MEIINGIPLEAIILESVIALMIGILALRTYVKYRERKRLSTFYLFLTILFYSFAVFSSDIGKIIDFFIIDEGSTTVYSPFTINFAYCFVALGNIFLYSFNENIFLDDNKERKFFVAVLYGLLIGIMLSLNGLDEDAYARIFPYLILFILLAIITYGTLFYYSIKESRKTEDRVPKVGFIFIGLFGVFAFLTFVLFGIDIIKITLTDNDYNIEYYLAWVSTGLATLSGYLGYILPDWFRGMIGGNS